MATRGAGVDLNRQPHSFEQMPATLVAAKQFDCNSKMSFPHHLRATGRECDIQPMKYAFLVAALIGATLLIIGMQMPAYKDEARYQSAYMAIDPQSEDASTKFSELRRNSLTNRYLLEDYGVIFLSLGAIGGLVLRRKERKIHSPKSGAHIAALGLLSAAVTTLGLTAYLFVGLSRGDYPYWADSAGIGIAAVLFSATLMFVFATLHLPLLRRGFAADQRVSLQPSIKSWWLSLMTVLSLVALAVSILQADPWTVPGLALWAYFFASLKSGRPRH